MNRRSNRYARSWYARLVKACGVYFLISVLAPLTTRASEHPAPPAPPKTPAPAKAYCIEAEAEPRFAERRRMITKTYSVTQKDRLYVSNQYGEVRIRLWDRPEVRADITITANGSTEDEAQSFLEKVQIDDERQGDQIRLTTQCENITKNSSSVFAWSNRRTDITQRGVRIQYIVSLPRYTALELRGHFSDAVIPEFTAPLTVQCNYGTVTAGKLAGLNNDIRVYYGNAVIKALEKGKLNIEYSKLLLDKAEDLILDNKYGPLHIGEVDKLVAELSYSSGQIETLKESARMQLRYLSNFRLPVLPRNMKTVEINSKCSDLRLPVSPESDLDFDVTVKYADFRYPTERVSFSRKEEGDNQHGRPKMQKTYVGKVGKGGGTVKITSDYGSVKFVD